VLVKEIDHGLVLAAPTKGYVRTPGLHASDLYGAYYKDHDPKRYDKKDKDGKAVPFDLAKMEMGTSFEEVLEPVLKERLFGERNDGYRPGEFTAPHVPGCPHDGLECDAETVCPECGAGTLFSPDYLFELAGRLILGEFKCTWYSSNGAPTNDKFAKWLTQIKLYLLWLTVILGMDVTKVRLFVLFVNDDYKPPTPKLRAWEITFTKKELMLEHKEIIRHAKKKGLLVAK
jgi:hypothetical protein